jgi:hypothetical protein
MKTLVEPEDTVAAVLFLASEAGRYITGVKLKRQRGDTTYCTHFPMRCYDKVREYKRRWFD